MREVSGLLRGQRYQWRRGLPESETPKQVLIVGRGLQTELDLDVDQLFTNSSPVLSSASLSESNGAGN